MKWHLLNLLGLAKKKIMIKEELKIFLTAVMFYTRIPCPSWVDHSAEYVNKSVRYFPLIGVVVGGLASVGLIAGSWLVSPFLGGVLFITISVWLTGAFHEDGFADVCDGFGGGWTQEQILNIMKDSRVGTYAVVGLLLLFAAKIGLIVEIISKYDFLMLFFIATNGHILSRFIAATVIFTHKYVREDELSKAKPVAKSYTIPNIIISSMLGISPTIFISFFTGQIWWIAIPFILYLVKMWLSQQFQKRIGGYTGDCLGATQQLTEVAYYFSVVLLWKFT